MSKFKKLLQQIELTNRRRRLIRQNDSLVVAVSGGPDSTVLLELLSKIRRKYSLKITAAHLDHGLSAQSRKYLSTAKQAAKKLHVPFYSKKIRLKSLAKKYKRSLEEMGRLQRYQFFEEVAKKVSANKLVTAHTLDDQAETMLMRIFRGSGLRGLTGIPYQRPQGKYQVIRPLLDCSKQDILNFLKENRIPFCLDKTNQDPVFTRNRLRHQFLPQIARAFNPQIKQSLATLQAVCAETRDYLENMSKRALKQCLKRTEKQKILLNVSRLKRLHPALRSEVLYLALSEMRGDSKRFDYEHLSALSDAIRSDEDGLEVHLPGSLRAVKKRGVLVIASIDTPAK